MKPCIFVVTMLALLLSAGYALAQTGGGYDLTWWTVDAGGGTSSGGGYTLSGAIGQPDAAPALSGGGYALVGGFWAGEGGATPAGPPTIYLPAILK